MQKSGSRSRTRFTRCHRKTQALPADRGDLPGLRVARVRTGRHPPPHRRAPPSVRRSCSSTVTVTAQKRTENLQKVPISIQVLGDAEARRAERHRLRGLRQVPAERLLPDASARASRRSTCAASPAAATATTPARCPASACTSTSSRSRRSRARSTCTSTTSPASRRWPARRARCTAPAPRPARSASSPTSRTRAASRPATTSKCNAVDQGGIGYIGRRLRQHPDGRLRGDPPGRLGPARRRLHRHKRAIASSRRTLDEETGERASWGGVLTNRDCTSTDLLVCTAAPRTTTTTSTPPARARR